MYVCMYVCMYIRMYVCMYVYVCMNVIMSQKANIQYLGHGPAAAALSSTMKALAQHDPTRLIKRLIRLLKQAMEVRKRSRSSSSSSSSS